MNNISGPIVTAVTTAIILDLKNEHPYQNPKAFNANQRIWFKFLSEKEKLAFRHNWKVGER